MTHENKRRTTGLVMALSAALIFGLFLSLFEGDGRADVAVQYLDNVGPQGTMFVDCSYTREEILAEVETQLKEMGK
jgi:hypothetical protein